MSAARPRCGHCGTSADLDATRCRRCGNDYDATQLWRRVALGGLGLSLVAVLAPSPLIIVAALALIWLWRRWGSDFKPRAWALVRSVSKRLAFRGYLAAVLSLVLFATCMSAGFDGEAERRRSKQRRENRVSYLADALSEANSSVICSATKVLALYSAVDDVAKFASVSRKTAKLVVEAREKGGLLKETQDQIAERPRSLADPGRFEEPPYFGAVSFRGVLKRTYPDSIVVLVGSTYYCISNAVPTGLGELIGGYMEITGGPRMIDVGRTGRLCQVAKFADVETYRDDQALYAKVREGARQRHARNVEAYNSAQRSSNAHKSRASHLKQQLATRCEAAWGPLTEAGEELLDDAGGSQNE